MLRKSAKINQTPEGYPVCLTDNRTTGVGVYTFPTVSAPVCFHLLCLITPPVFFKLDGPVRDVNALSLWEAFSDFKSRFLDFTVF